MGSIAIVIDDEFTPFYDSCAAIFTGLVASTVAPTMVRNKALESFSMICEAVGKEKSGMDAAQVLNELVRALVRHVKQGTITSYLLVSLYIGLHCVLSASNV
jgi:hypothetical protein